MADHKPGRGNRRNPVPKRSAFSRRYTHGSRPVHVSFKMDGGAAKQHQASFAPTWDAMAQYQSPVDNDTRSESDYSTIPSYYHPKPAIYDISEVPDINIYNYNRQHTDYDLSSKASPAHSSSGKAERKYSSSDTPQGYFLPPSVRLSPLPSFKNDSDLSSHPPSLSDGSASPLFDKPSTPRYIPTNPTVIQPQHLGWDEFRASRASFDVNKDSSPESLHTPCSTSGKQLPLAPQPRFRSEVAQEKRSKRVHPTSNKKTANSRKQSDMETLTSVHRFGKKLQVVYQRGPKGEGQKMWNGIRRKHKEERELRTTQAPLKTPWAAHSPRAQAVRTQAQQEQLLDLHAAALHMPAPKAPLISPPLQSLPRPPVPARPAPLGILRSPVIYKPLPGFVPMQLREGGGSQGKVSTASTSTYRSWDVPVTASRSVQYDSRECIIDYPQTKPSVPHLDPAPKRKAVQKRGLPPRPIPGPGEKEPPELADQDKMYKLRTGTSPPRPGADSLPPAPKCSVGSTFPATTHKPSNNLPVPAGSSLAVGHQFPYAAINPPNFFISLDDDQTERPRHQKASDKAPKNPFTNLVSHFFDLPSHLKEKSYKDPFADVLAHQKDKARAKYQQKLKEHISNPRPVVAPAAFTANVSAAAGGVGGSAAAVTVAPRLPNPTFALAPGNGTNGCGTAGKLPASTQPPVSSEGGFRDAVKDEGGKVARVPPPVPPLPTDYVFLCGDGQADLNEKGKGKGKAKKDKKANWAVPFPRGRRDSDASMVCADARLVSREHWRLFNASQKGKQKAEGEPGHGVVNMGRYVGPVRQNPPKQVQTRVRDPGPSNQFESWQVEDENELLELLGVRKGEEDGSAWL
jgi:hypothetical protein